MSETYRTGETFRLNFSGNGASGVAAEVELARVEVEEVGQHLREAEARVVKVDVEAGLESGDVAQVLAADAVVADDVVLGTWGPIL
jgi:hypothetical protein